MSDGGGRDVMRDPSVGFCSGVPLWAPQFVLMSPEFPELHAIPKSPF
jgi:hypothetical protein